MPFGGRSLASEGGGVELARGYISLTAKYSPAMAQIANDFKALESEADRAGIVAGAKLKAGIAGGAVPLGTHLRNEFAKAGRVMTSDAEAYGAVIGGALGRGISAPFRAVDRVVGNLGTSIKNTVTGPMAKMVGGATVLGIAFETMSKGWELDVKIDKTRTQLEGLGASVQDIQGFMSDVQEATKNTSNSFSDVADVAKDLFAEGRRGNALVEELRTVQNMAAIAGKDVESLWSTFEKAHGRDAINPMVLGSLQMQGIPAREELAKALNLKGTADEINKALDAELKKKGGGPTWDLLFQQFAKDFPDAAEKYSKSLEGQMKKVQTNLGKVGGDFLKGALGGGTGGLDGINAQLEKLDNWVNTHQGEIHNFFKQLASVAKDVANAIVDIKGIIDQIPGGIKTVIDVWLSWKVLSMVSDIGAVKGAVELLGVAVEAVDFAAWLGPLGLVATVIGALVVSIKEANDGIRNQNYLADHMPDATPDHSHDVPYSPGVAPPPAAAPHGVPPSLKSLITGQHAKGAVIQPPVSPNGIVQWAEPSTGGEAYIPLGLSNRSRSLAIWKETGRRLRAFAGGGVNLPGYSWNENASTAYLPVDEDSASAKLWSRNWNINKLWQYSGTRPNNDLLSRLQHFNRDPGSGRDDRGLWPGMSRNRFAFDTGGITGGPDGKKLKAKWIDDKSKGINWNSPLGPLGWLVDWVSHDTGDVSGPGDFGTSSGSPTIAPNDENAIRNWVQQQFGIPNTKGTGSWENSAHNHDGGLHHRGLGGKDVGSGYAFDFHGTPSQMSALANWVASNYAKDTLELIYSGAGFDHNREIKNGKFGDVYGAGTNSQHTDHVHWAMTGMPGGSAGDGSAVPVDISKVDGKSVGAKGGGSGGSGGGGGGGGIFGTLGGILDSGLKETFLPPGFTDYSQNSWVKSGKVGLDMLLGMSGIGSGGGAGGGLGGLNLGDAMMHPLRGPLAQMDPGKAAALGWTQPGAGDSPPSHGRVSPGSLAAGLHGNAGGGGDTINISGTVMDKGAQERLDQMQKDKKLTDARAGKGSGVSTQRVGQPGG